MIAELKTGRDLEQFVFLMILTYVSSRPSGVGNDESEDTKCKLCPMIHGKKKRH